MLLIGWKFDSLVPPSRENQCWRSEVSTVSQARKAKYGNLSIRKAATGVNGKGCEKNLKLWEVSAKDEKKNGKAYLGTNGEKEGEGSVTCTKAVWMVQRVEKFANDEKWRERSCYGREAFIWWKARENTTVIIVETRSNDDKRWKAPRLLLKRSVRVMKSAGKVKRTVPGKAHEERQYKFDKFCLVPHWLKFVNLSWRIGIMLRNDLSL